MRGAEVLPPVPVLLQPAQVPQGVSDQGIVDCLLGRFICLCPDVRNNANYVECKVDQEKDGVEEMGDSSTHTTSHVETTQKETVTTAATVETSSTSQSTSTATTTTTATSTVTTTTTTVKTTLTTASVRKTTTTPAPVIVFPVTETSTTGDEIQKPRKTSNDKDVVTNTEFATTMKPQADPDTLNTESNKIVFTESLLTESLITTSAPDQPWITGQTETTNIPTDDDNEDKFTTATTESPQSTTLEFTEGEISTLVLTLDQDAETEKILIGDITTSDPEVEVTVTPEEKESQSTTTLSDLIRGTFRPAEPTVPSDDVTTEGEMINGSTISQDDIADEVGGPTTISSGELTTSQPDLITQNYKIIFDPSTDPVIIIDTTTAPAVTTTDSVGETSTPGSCPGSVECNGVCLLRHQLCCRPSFRRQL